MSDNKEYLNDEFSSHDDKSQEDEIVNEFDFMKDDLNQEEVPNEEISHPGRDFDNESFDLEKDKAGENKKNILSKVLSFFKKENGEITKEEVSPDDKILNSGNDEGILSGKKKPTIIYFTIALIVLVFSLLSYQLFFKTEVTDSNNGKLTESKESSNIDLNVGELPDIINETNNAVDESVSEIGEIEEKDNSANASKEKQYNPIYIFTYIPELFTNKLYVIDEKSFEAKDEYFSNFLNKDGFAKILEKNVEAKNELLMEFKEEKALFEKHDKLDIYYSVRNLIFESIDRDEDLYKITNDNLGRHLIQPTIDKSLEKEESMYYDYQETIMNFLNRYGIEYHKSEELVYERYREKIRKINFSVSKYIYK